MNEPEESNWLKFLRHLAGRPDIKGIEIGTFRGESAEWAMKNIFTHPSSCYYCVDPFTFCEQKEHGMDCTNVEQEACSRLSVFPQSRIIKGYSQNVLRTFSHKLDFGYVDGSHKANDVLRDSVLLFDLMKVGGTIIWDDFMWDITPDELDKPRIAIEAFLKIYAHSLRVEFVGWQIIAVKTKE